MTQRRALDFSTDFPDRFPKDAIDLGYTVFILYLGYGSKVATPSRITRILEAGGRIGLVWEVTGGAEGYGVPSGPAFFTKQRGRDDATAAISQAKQLGAPRGICIFYAADTSITAEQAVEYYNGIDEIHAEQGNYYTVGDYGDFSLVIANWPGVPYRWQTVAWSGGQISSIVNLYQDDSITIDGVRCDINEIMSEDLSWSWGKEEDLAGITGDQAKDIWREMAQSDEGAVLVKAAILHPGGYGDALEVELEKLRKEAEAAGTPIDEAKILQDATNNIISKLQK